MRSSIKARLTATPRHSKSSRSKLKKASKNSRSKPKPRSSSRKRKHRHTKRKRRAYQYKSLREIIEKTTIKPPNRARETLITYYQTFTTSYDLMEELEHRFFSVLPTEKEERQQTPYISDTDSDFHFKFGHRLSNRNSTAIEERLSIIDREDQLYQIQLAVINLLTYWIKHFYIEDFNEEPDMLELVELFIYQIRSLRTRVRIPSIPIDGPNFRQNSEITPSNLNPPLSYNRSLKFSPNILAKHESNDPNAFKFDKRSTIATQTSVSKLVYQNIIRKNHSNDVIIHTKGNSNDRVVKGNNSGASALTHWGGHEHLNKIKQKKRKYDHHHHQPSSITPTSRGSCKIHGNKEKENRLQMTSNPLHPEHSPKNVKKYKTPKSSFDDEMSPMGTDLINEYSNAISPMTSAIVEEKMEEKMAYIVPPPTPGDDIGEVKEEIVITESNDRVLIASHQMFENTDYNGVFWLDVCTVQNGQIVVENINDYEHIEWFHDTKPKAKNQNNGFFTSQRQLLKKRTNSSTLKPNLSSGSGKIPDPEIFENDAVTPNTNSDKPLILNSDFDSENNSEEISGQSMKTPFDKTKRYYVENATKYHQLADKLEKILNKERKAASTELSVIRHTGKIPTLIWDRFREDIKPLKEDFQKNVKNEDIAHQITIMTFGIFSKVKKREFIDQAWKMSTQRTVYAPNICKLIDHFNNISKWVQVTILRCENAKKRGRMIKKFIKIMLILLKLNNFQSLCAVYGAVTSACIFSLEHAWNQVPKKHKEKFDEDIRQHFITANNMQNLRDLHHNRVPPMIPYTGIYLQDLIQTEERFKDRMLKEQMKRKNKDFDGSGGVVFEHLTRISRAVDDILIYQKTPYVMEDNHTIQMFLQSEFEDNRAKTDEDIYKLSENVAKTDAV